MKIKFDEIPAEIFGQNFWLKFGFVNQITGSTKETMHI